MSVWDNRSDSCVLTIHHHSTKTQNRQASTTRVERIGDSMVKKIDKREPLRPPHYPDSRAAAVMRTRAHGSNSYTCAHCYEFHNYMPHLFLLLLAICYSINQAGVRGVRGVRSNPPKNDFRRMRRARAGGNNK